MGNTNVSPKGRLVAVVVAMLSLGLMLTGGCSSPKLVDAFVTIVPGNTTVGTGATFTMYTAASPSGVTWAISKTTGCTGTACGTLSGATDTSVVYNAPVSMSGSDDERHDHGDLQNRLLHLGVPDAHGLSGERADLRDPPTRQSFL